jgi:hypothetical protein
VRKRSLFVVPSLILLIACSSGSTVPFGLEVAPEIIHGLYPETGCIVLARVISTSNEPVSLRVEAPGAEAVARPDAIVPGEVAEIEITPGPANTEIPLTITVTGARGTEEQTVVRETRVMPFEPPTQEARLTFELFVDWLAANRPDLGITDAGAFEGRGVNPVLVVSHYQFLSDEWELALSWHVMIPPHDWSELTLRHRDAWTPTVAFHLASRSAAFDEGIVEIDEITPPAEILR